MCNSGPNRRCDEPDHQQRRREQWGWRRRRAYPGCSDTAAPSSIRRCVHCYQWQPAGNTADVCSGVTLKVRENRVDFSSLSSPSGESLLSHICACRCAAGELLATLHRQTLHSMEIWKASSPWRCNSVRLWASSQDKAEDGDRTRINEIPSETVYFSMNKSLLSIRWCDKVYLWFLLQVSVWGSQDRTCLSLPSIQVRDENLPHLSIHFVPVEINFIGINWWCPNVSSTYSANVSTLKKIHNKYCYQ